jgi:anti-anti-sigma factor
MNDGPTSAQVRSSREPGALVLHLEGVIDAANVSSARTLIETSLSDVGADRVTFDLERLTFLDSAGIGLLLSVTRNISDLSLRHASRVIRSVLAITGLTERLPLLD